jgi:uncharacterized protein (TIGR03437 family)
MAGAAAAQTLTTGSLTGKYFFRHLMVLSDASGNVTDTRSLLGAVTFDGSGSFTFTGQQNVGKSAAAALTGSGTYSVDPAGFVSMTNPQSSTFTLNARFSSEAVAGSSTESTNNTFDIFIAIPAPASGVSNASLSGGYWMAGLELPGAAIANARTSFFLLNANAGAFGSVSVNGHTPGTNSGAPYAETIAGAKYQLNGDGTGTANFPGSTLVADNKTIYVSKDGNMILGGSTAAGAHDLLVGVKQIPGQLTAANWKGSFWSAGLRIDGTSLTAFSGSTYADGVSTLLLTRRIHAIGATASNGAIDFTGVNPYNLASDGSGGALLDRAAIGAGGAAFVNAEMAITEPTVYELYVGVQLPALAGSGVFLNPQRLANTASFAPAGDPIAPGEFLALFGSGLGPATLQVETTSTFPASLGGVSVSINNTPAPLYFVSAGQLAALIPFNLQGTTASIVVTYNGARSNTVTVPVAKTSPGIFSLNQSGAGPGAILHANFQIVNTGNPAKPGETILIYLTGMGAVSPARGDGVPGASAEPFNRTAETPVVYFGDKTGTVTYSGLAPGLPGLYQINVTIPANVAIDSGVPLAISTAEHYHDQVTVAISQ